MSQHIVCSEGRRFGLRHPVWEEFRKLRRLELHETRPSSSKEIIAAVQGASVLVGDDMGMDDAMLETLPALKLLCIWRTGYDDTDVEAAGRRNVAVS